MRSTFFSGRVTNLRHAYNALELLPRLRHFTDAESLRSKADIPPSFLRLAVDLVAVLLVFMTR